MRRQYIVKMIGNDSDWLSYTGGALIKVADSEGSTVPLQTQIKSLIMVEIISQSILLISP